MLVCIHRQHPIRQQIDILFVLGTVLGDEFSESTNLGVRDQIAALEWVRDHIERFGGDPNNVTVFGQSAGGMSVGTLLGAPRARKLFHRAIPQSGAADHVIEREEAARIASELLRRLGGPPPSLEALGRIPIETLLEAYLPALAEAYSTEEASAVGGLAAAREVASIEKRLQDIAIEELTAQRNRLGTYMVQARFSLAAIYDRAAAVVPAPEREPEPEPDTEAEAEDELEAAVDPEVVAGGPE